VGKGKQRRKERGNWKKKNATSPVAKRHMCRQNIEKKKQKEGRDEGGLNTKRNRSVNQLEIDMACTLITRDLRPT